MPGQLGRRKTIGQLRHRLELQAPADALDKYRAPVKSWATEATVWGEVRLDDGAEFPRSGGTQANVTGSVLMRFRAGVTPRKRFVWKRPTAGDLVLNITAAPPAEGRENFILCRVTAEV